MAENQKIRQNRHLFMPPFILQIRYVEFRKSGGNSRKCVGKVVEFQKNTVFVKKWPANFYKNADINLVIIEKNRLLMKKYELYYEFICEFMNS